MSWHTCWSLPTPLCSTGCSRQQQQRRKRTSSDAQCVAWGLRTPPRCTPTSRAFTAIRSLEGRGSLLSVFLLFLSSFFSCSSLRSYNSKRYACPLCGDDAPRTNITYHIGALAGLWFLLSLSVALTVACRTSSFHAFSHREVEEVCLFARVVARVHSACVCRVCLRIFPHPHSHCFFFQHGLKVESAVCGYSFACVICVRQSDRRVLLVNEVRSRAYVSTFVRACCPVFVLLARRS